MPMRNGNSVPVVSAPSIAEVVRSVPMRNGNLAPWNASVEQLASS
ncbi:protein of unknown function [Kyrpidia spormannii]|uniref:Uncharacterized protein n=1 Tax=Kyrpidia spormannii TaxID=2055160 RepID=A0A6F9EGU4_9BACL|nr:protein of unknown function [Kyrpidia spormannii]